MDSQQPTLLVLDSPSVVYRAFFAVPKSITGPDGVPVNAVRGYLDMFSRLLVDHRPAAVLHVLDADWRPQWRVDAWPGYKASRRDDPPELPGQFAMLGAVLEAAGLPVAEASGYEADDVIGTVAAAAGPDERLAVVTGDRDLLQVIRDPVVWVLFPVKGTSQLTRYDEAAVAERYGVPPARYVDYAILRGDPSDGLPGIAGVGQKTAARLVSEFASLDELVAASGRLAPRLASALRGSVEYLAAMRRIVPVAIDVAWTATPSHPPDRERLDALAAAHGIEGPVQRLQAAMVTAGLAPADEQAPA